MTKLYIYNSLELPKDLPDFVEVREYPKNKRIILVSPHSDDISVACGGTVSALADVNQIIPVLFFAGYRGVKGVEKVRATKIREKEMKEETKILGGEKPLFLRLRSYEDQGLVARKEDILQVERVFVEHQPDIVFLPKKDDLQPRHKLATQISLKALKNFYGQKGKERKFPSLFFYENPWSLFDAFEFNAIFILSKKALAQKLKAIRVHRSQLKRTAFDKAAEALVNFRAVVVPEQRIFGYGNNGRKMNRLYLEAFKLYENNR